MRARLSRYKWELWLLIGIPFLVQVAYSLSVLVLQFVGWVSYVEPFVVNPARLLLLSVSYWFWVRRLDREFLVSLWGYLIVVAAIGSVESVMFRVLDVIYGPGLVFVSASVGLLLLFPLLSYLVLLWFARKLSRTGLSYAFFLVVFTSLNLIVLPSVTPVEPALRTATISSIISIVALPWIPLLKVWLLGNFERRDERFRRNAIIVLAIALTVNSYIWIMAGILLGAFESPFYTIFPFFDLTFGNVAAFIATFIVNALSLFMLFGVVYLIRVRKDVEKETLRD